MDELWSCGDWVHRDEVSHRVKGRIRWKAFQIIDNHNLLPHVCLGKAKRKHRTCWETQINIGCHFYTHCIQFYLTRSVAIHVPEVCTLVYWFVISLLMHQANLNVLWYFLTLNVIFLYFFLLINNAPVCNKHCTLLLLSMI